MVESYLNMSPPACPDIEKSILATFFQSKTQWSKYSGLILPEYFYVSDHKKIFEFMITSNITDSRIVLEKHPDTQTAILEILGGYSPQTNVESQIEILKDRFERRRIIQTSHNALQGAFCDYDTPISSLVESSILGLSASFVSSSKVEHIRDILPRVLIELNASLETGDVWYKTGISDIDDLIGGFLLGEMIIMAGRPSMGKTSFALQVVRHIAINKKIPVLFFSLETTKSGISGRIISSESHACYDYALRGYKEALTKINNEAPRVSLSDIYIDDTCAITMSQIEMKSENYVKNNNVKMIFIDHIGLIKGVGGRSRHEELSVISKSIKALGKKLNVVIIPLCQLSREVDKRSPPIPMLSDLRESGSLEEDADKVLFLYREEYYNRKSTKKGVCEIIAAKNKNGKTGHKDIYCDLSTFNFCNLAKEEEQTACWQDGKDDR